jgi:hypothetical protein
MNILNRIKESKKWRYGAVASLAAASTITYAWCPPFLFLDEWVNPAFANSTFVLTGAIAAVDGALSAQLLLNGERMASALAVLTKQKAVAANQIAESSRNSAQMTATALGILSTSAAVKKASFDFSGALGQGFAPCDVRAKRDMIATRDAEMTDERSSRVLSEIDAAPGRYGDPIQAQRAQLAAHKQFCTQDQVDSGLCAAVGALPGADLSVGSLFKPSMEGESMYAAKVAFVNNIVGVPNGVVPLGANNTPAAAAYSLAKSRKDAIISSALVSFKEIQLDYSGVTTDHGGKNLPMALLFGDEVKRYFGNSVEHDKWRKAMVSQNERGAMVELLKIKALDLALQEKQFRQYERMEASLASLVAMEVEASGLTGLATSTAERAMRQNINNAIK